MPKPLLISSTRRPSKSTSSNMVAKPVNKLNMMLTKDVKLDASEKKSTRNILRLWKLPSKMKVKEFIAKHKLPLLIKNSVRMNQS